MSIRHDRDRLEREEFHQLQLAEARRRYEDNRTPETKKAYLTALAHFAAWCMGARSRMGA